MFSMESRIISKNVFADTVRGEWMYFTSSNLTKWFLSTWAFIGLVLALVTSFLYLIWSGFGEQGEVNFAAVSWLVYHGHPLYTSVASAERYSLQHGPNIYLIIGGIMGIFGPSYITAKISSIIMFLTSLILSFVWFSRFSHKRLAFILVGLETWLLFHWHNSYYIRPDSALLLCILISLYVVTTVKNKKVLILACAITFGLIINLKVHGLIYLVPIIALLSRQLNIKHILSLGILTAIISALPFLLPQIVLENYIVWIKLSVHMVAKDPLVTLKNFLPKAAIIIELSLIPICLAVINRIDLGGFYNRNKLLITTTFFSFIFAAIIGSKPGSGTNHLLPLIPVYCYILLLLANEVSSNASFSMKEPKSKFLMKCCYTILGAIFVTITLSGINKEIGLLKPVFSNDRTPVIRELAAIEKLYAGKTLEIGYGQDNDRAISDCIPLLVFHGNPLLIEKVALGDMLEMNMPIPSATLAQLVNGEIQVWLIPAGQTPFGFLDNNFRQTFFSNYTLAEKKKFFDIWVHKSIVQLSQE